MSERRQKDVERLDESHVETEGCRVRKGEERKKHWG